MDIEERAERYVKEHFDLLGLDLLTRKEILRALIEAYLAGAARAQTDYVAYYGRTHNAR